MGRYHYDTPNPDPWPVAVRVDGFSEVACYVLGWQLEPDADTEWTGIEHRTDQLVVIMVGDDAHHLVDIDDIHTLSREDYCGVCGQIGCQHDGLDRQ